jgi:hypothetical protein
VSPCGHRVRSLLIGPARATATTRSGTVHRTSNTLTAARARSGGTVIFSTLNHYRSTVLAHFALNPRMSCRWGPWSRPRCGCARAKYSPGSLWASGRSARGSLRLSQNLLNRCFHGATEHHAVLAESYPDGVLCSVPGSDVMCSAGRPRRRIMNSAMTMLGSQHRKGTGA